MTNREYVMVFLKGVRSCVLSERKISRIQNHIHFFGIHTISCAFFVKFRVRVRVCWIV